MSDGCEHCAALKEHLETLRLTIQDNEREMRFHRRKIGQLEGQLTRERDESPDMPLAKALFERWKAKTGKSSRTIFGPARQEKILRAIKIVSSHPGLDP